MKTTLAFKIMADDSCQRYYHKSCFNVLNKEGEKMEDKNIKIRCIKTMNFDYLTIGKEYRVIEEEPQGYKIINDDGSIRRYHKSLFKPIEQQKELKKNFREVIADIKNDEKWTDGETVITMKNDKITIQNISGNSYTASTYSETYRNFVKVEEPKPVSTSEAFKALDEGKTIESWKGFKYKKENGTIKCVSKDVIRFDFISNSELEGQWIINN